MLSSSFIGGTGSGSWPPEIRASISASWRWNAQHRGALRLLQLRVRILASEEKKANHLALLMKHTRIRTPQMMLS